MYASSARADAFLDGKEKQTDEILSIESVEVKQVSYIQIPIYIYISDTGTEFDILPKEPRQRNLFNSIRDAMITAIVQGSLLNDVFFSSKPQFIKQAREGYLKTDEWLKLFTDDGTPGKDGETDPFTGEAFYSYRKLEYGELPLWFGFNARKSSQITIRIDSLDAMASSSEFLTMLSEIPSKVKWILYYDHTNNYDKSIERIQRVKHDCSPENVLRQKHDEQFYVQFDDDVIVREIPETMFVTDSMKYIVISNYYTELKK